MKESVHEIIRRAENNYVFGKLRIGSYVDWSMHETIQRAIAYINSRHISGDKDSLGRDKPFFNIVTAVINIWYRATDIDRKDITVRADKTSNTIAAFFANALLQDWMRRTNFGTFLNQWGRTLAKHGSAIVKFVEKGGKLIPTVVPWSRIICDQKDFEALPRIEKLHKTPAQLRKEELYDQDAVERLISSVAARKTLEGNQIDNVNDFIELYEVHGELPIGLLKDNPSDNDWKNFRQQVHIVSFQKGKDGKYEDYTLYKGKEAKDPYMLTHLIEEDDRTLAIGAVEYCFDAQWMVNHTVKNTKDTLDLASKLIFQTSDANYLNRNILTQIETGQVLIHKENQALTQLNNSKIDITSLQNFGQQWRVLTQEITATPEAARGITPPSGTPLGTTQALLAQSNSLFHLMHQNKGLHLEEMMRGWVIPHLKTKMNTKDEVMALLNDYDLKTFDSMFVPNEAVRRFNRRVFEEMMAEKTPAPFNPAEEQAAVRAELQPLGNRRPLSPGDINWKEALKDIEWEFEFGITNEPTDKQAVLQTLSSVLQSVAQNPNLLLDPTAKLVFSKILNIAGGISPVEITSTVNAVTQPIQANMMELAGGGTPQGRVPAIVK